MRWGSSSSPGWPLRQSSAFLDPRPVDGLYLFERPEKLEVPGDYGDIVERYQQTDASLFEEPEERTEPPVLGRNSAAAGRQHLGGR